MRRLSVVFRRALTGLAALAAVSCSISLLVAEETALDRYVAKPDHTYAWKIIHKEHDNGVTTYVVDLKSQTWRKPSEVDRPVWQHWVTILKPDQPSSHTAFLFITGGSNGGNPPNGAGGPLKIIAAGSKAVIVELKMVPNEPLEFHHDGHQRKEDDLIAYTWNQFLKGGDDEWPARLPMVKSAVRAMDCVQELLKGDEGEHFDVDKFVVSGGSKRGWTTWCTAAVDKRVAAIVPSSIDCLNNAASMRHHVACYGFYTEAVGDYVHHKIMEQSLNPRMKLLHDIEDPYSYRDRLTMPKYIVNAAGDQYFCPDSSQFYFGDLPNEKYLRYIPNTDHSLRGSDAAQTILAFFYSIIHDTKRPVMSWTFENDGSIRVKSGSSPAPKKVLLWQASNPDARDFRLMTIGKAYKSLELKDEGDGTYVGKITKPEKGWTASFVELSYDVGAPFPLKVTTGVRVTPDILPHQDIDPTKARYESVHRRRRAGQPAS